MSDLKVHVTDHAIVRYLERCQGLDVDGLKQTIAGICERGVACGAPCVRHDMARYILVKNRVVTVLNRSSAPTHSSLVKALNEK